MLARAVAEHRNTGWRLAALPSVPEKALDQTLGKIPRRARIVGVARSRQRRAPAHEHLAVLVPHASKIGAERPGIEVREVTPVDDRTPLAWSRVHRDHLPRLMPFPCPGRRHNDSIQSATGCNAAASERYAFVS